MMTLQERVHGAPRPQNWSLNKLHHTLRVRTGNKNKRMKEENLLSLSYGRIIPKDICSAEGLLPESFETYQIVDPGNIVMRLTDLQNDKRSLRQGLVKERGIVTSAYDALEVTRGHDPRFWAYALLALDLAKYYYSLGGGVRQSVKFADFPNDWISVPDENTQRAIAGFLDRETSRIDRLIDKKQALIESLKSEHQSFVTCAVTLGLDHNAALKPSGYSWHPHVPEHWMVIRLKFLCSRIVDCLHETPDHSDTGDYPSIRTADISRGQLHIEGAKRVTALEYLHRIQRLEPREHDVLYTREGERFGLAALVPKNTKLCLGQRMMMFRTNSRVQPAYLMWSLNAEFAYNYLKQSTAGATSPHLNIFDIRNVPIFVPPHAEQSLIVEAIDARFVKMARFASLTNSSIDRLWELRNALITAAVTGQIDVATWHKRGETDRRLDRMEKRVQLKEAQA